MKPCKYDVNKPFKFYSFVFETERIQSVLEDQKHMLAFKHICDLSRMLFLIVM